MQQERHLVDAAEGERLTGLAKATLYKLARQGRIRSFRVLDRALRFERADLVALVEEERRTPEGQPHRASEAPRSRV